MFIQYLAEQGHNVVKSERKPRKTVQYKDLGRLYLTRGRSPSGSMLILVYATASAVSHIDNLEFLADVIPKTTTYKQFKEKKAKDAAKHTEMEKGQRTLNGNGSAPSNTNGASTESGLPHTEAAISSPSVPRTPVVPVSALIADRTVHSSARNDPDVEMKD